MPGEAASAHLTAPALIVLRTWRSGFLFSMNLLMTLSSCRLRWLEGQALEKGPVHRVSLAWAGPVNSMDSSDILKAALYRLQDGYHVRRVFVG